ncbi:hypothetical protein [Streptomyces katsurahamanus]|uniref:Uncharacterized protein n=1 Tax=Streptomyces katsurahamanus TaxID=2577098 RepID=A0ABW9P2H8_9ACTN|nr:hypothetical protein [Streptomyces katsurahamanus]MQS39801.1 hypothetical protein [Streptomyces katsurahamanus]
MNDETRLRIRHTFDRLLAGGREPTEIDRSLMEAFERLMHGLPEVTDGEVRRAACRPAYFGVSNWSASTVRG